MNETTQSQGINWDAFFGNAQKSVNILDQLFATVNGGGRNNAPAPTTTGNALPGWVIWAGVGSLILVTLYLIYKK